MLKTNSKRKLLRPPPGPAQARSPPGSLLPSNPLLERIMRSPCLPCLCCRHRVPWPQPYRYRPQPYRPQPYRIQPCRPQPQPCRLRRLQQLLRDLWQGNRHHHPLHQQLIQFQHARGRRLHHHHLRLTLCKCSTLRLAPVKLLRHRGDPP